MTSKTNSKITVPKARHRTTPLPGTITYVPNYPQKLTLYKIEASSYWWVRYYSEGKVLRRTTKTDNLTKAYKFAKVFYDDINRRRADGLGVTDKSRFVACAASMLTSMRAQVARKELTQQTVQMTEYRLNKSILPFFGEYDVAEIKYEMLEAYLVQLSHMKEPIGLSTIGMYMKLVHKVLNYALKHRLLNHLPHFPSVGTEDNARGYFSTKEYRLLHSRARALVGKRFEYRKLTNGEGGEKLGEYYLTGTCKEGRVVRAITITEDLAELVVFMVNSFIRPTDIKNMQHKHVEIINSDQTYLRLSLPISKKHDKPIVTMKFAVDVYERLTQKNKARGLGVDANDYVFLPQYAKRDYALKQLQRQFDILMWSTKLGKGANDEDRTIYSLRHTCIMYRLMYGEAMDVITIARNARTSPEMINRFYASHLEGEDNVAMLQSRRHKKPTQAPKLT
jgi:integrase